MGQGRQHEATPVAAFIAAQLGTVAAQSANELLASCKSYVELKKTDDPFKRGYCAGTITANRFRQWRDSRREARLPTRGRNQFSGGTRRRGVYGSEPGATARRYSGALPSKRYARRGRADPRPALCVQRCGVLLIASRRVRVVSGRCHRVPWLAHVPVYWEGTRSLRTIEWRLCTAVPVANTIVVDCTAPVGRNSRNVTPRSPTWA